MYYFALVCPPDVDARVLTWKHWMQERFGCRNALRSPAHITLIPPFWGADAAAADLQQALRSFSSNTPPLDISLNGFSHFKRRVLFLAVEPHPELSRLRLELEAHLQQQLPGGIHPDDRPFHPHVTIATRDLKPDGFLQAWQRLEYEPFDAVFTTDSITLLRLGTDRWETDTVHDWQAPLIKI
ncbi:MAG TPA: 2'-5' RNA ligase family protein [Lacibacter sp.]|nr:2'-5' RNA ligase family protein [Lacibacter sp.]